MAGLVSVIGAMYFKKISYSVFANPAAFFVIIVGTVATVLNSFTGDELKNLGKLFGVIFSADKSSANIKKIIDTILSLAEKARKDGLLSLESQISALDDHFMKKGLTMAVDGAPEEYVADVLMTEIEAIEERHALNASIFSSAGTYAPTLGVLGAVFGLIAAMGHIDDTAEMSHAIAAAFIATILGIFTGYVLWNPFATKLKTKSKHEILEKKMIVEGVLSLQKGDPPVRIKEKLLAMLPETQQKLLDKDAE